MFDKPPSRFRRPYLNPVVDEIEVDQRLESVVALRAMNFGARPPVTVRVAGYTTAGDGGGGNWRRIGALSVHGAHETSADGLIWELIPAERLSARAFGFGVGGGNSASMNRAIAFAAALGSTIALPVGVYTLESDIVHTGVSLVTIMGAGMDATVLRKGAAAGGAFISFNDCTNFIISDMTLDCRRSVVGAGGHGLRLNRCPGAAASSIKVKDWTDTGIIAMDADSQVTFYDNILVENCVLEGEGGENNGILFTCARDSAMRDCTVKGMGRSGSPSFALQLKANCLRCRITSCTADDARAGIVIGNVDAGSNYCRVENCIIIRCSQAVRLSYCEYCNIVGVTIDMTDAADEILSGDYADEVAIKANFVNNSTFTGIVIRGYDYAGKYPVDLRQSAGVSVEIEAWNNVPDHDLFLRYDTGAGACKVTLKSYIGTVPEAWSDWISYVTVSTNNTTQILANGYSQRHTIASGAITLNDRGANRIILDTEAAAASDDLTTINNGVSGQTLFITPANDARSVVAKAAGGNLTMRAAADRTLTTRAHGLRVTRGLTSQWIEA